MATEVDKILVRIEADLADFRKDMNSLKKTTEQTTSVFRKLGPILAAAFSGVALRSITNTVRQFEDLQATLKAVTGSADMAKNSFDLITKFTATTTFQLEEVTGAFITLQNAGIAPTSDVLKDVGNLAAAYGKDIRDVSQAIMNATTGEMEMLKQLGVIARVEGDNLAVTYKGVTQTIDRSAESIVGYLRDLSQANFSTAIEERANTLSGAISNLQDNFSLFIMEIGDAGFRQSMTDLVKNLIGVVNRAKPLAIIIGRTLAAGFRGLGVAIDFVMENLKPLILATGTYFTIVSGVTLVNAAKGYYDLAKAIVKTTIATEALGKANLKNLIKNNKNLIGLGIAGAVMIAEQMGGLDEFNKRIDDYIDSLMGASNTGKALEELDAEIAKLGTNAPPAVAGLKETGDALTKMKEAAAAARWEAAGFSSEIAKVASKDAGFALFGGSVSFADAEAQARFTKLISAENDLLDQEKKVAQRNLAREFLNTKSAADELGQKIIDIKAGLKMMGEEGSMTAQAGLKNLQVELKMLDPAFSGLVSAAQNAASSVADAITEMVMSSKFNLDSFKDIARQFIAQLIKMQIMGAIMNPLMNRAFGLTGTDAAMPEFSMFSGKGMFATGDAGGGAMQPNMPHLVGERGPELFIPNSAGTLLNNMNTRNAMGGSATQVVNNVNVTTGVQNTVRAEIMNLLPQISMAVRGDIQGKEFRTA